MPAGERELVAKEIGEKNRDHDRWVIENYENHKFLEKWTQKKWETTPNGSLARKKAYTEFFNTGKDLQVQYNVEIRREHFLFGTISIGNNVLLAKNVFIDYSGDLVIEDNVKISDGVSIETHSHLGFTSTESGHAQKEFLVIGDHVNLGTKSIITESCHKIGRYAKIGAGAVVRSNIPPYAIVIGNPAKIIKFIYSPEEMANFEQSRYQDSDRTDIDVYTRNYKKLYTENIKEISSYLKIKA